MKLVCTMPVRNEDWILGLSARAVLMWCDELIILDHCSTDRSRRIEMEIAKEFPSRVTVLSDDIPEWQEMRHRQALLDEARLREATHIVMVDADEVLTGNLLGSIREHVRMAPRGTTMQLPWQCLRGSIQEVHADGVWGAATVCMAFLDEDCCYWAARAGYDFHHRQPMGRPFVPFCPVGRQAGGLMHLQFVSDRRLRAKQYLYQLTERLRWPGREPVEAVRKRYSLAVYDGKAMAPAPAAWWTPYKGLLGQLHADAEPWQEAECARIVAAHPGIAAGLDSFGVTRAQ
jgi:hypothetical protein